MPTNGTLHKYDGLSNCTCTYCEQQCNVASAPPFPAFMDGFDWVVVVAVYAGLIVLSIAIVFIKYKCGGKPKQSLVASSDSKQASNIY